MNTEIKRAIIDLIVKNTKIERIRAIYFANKILNHKCVLNSESIMQILQRSKETCREEISQICDGVLEFLENENGIYVICTKKAVSIKKGYVYKVTSFNPNYFVEIGGTNLPDFLQKGNYVCIESPDGLLVKGHLHTKYFIERKFGKVEKKYFQKIKGLAF